MQVKLSCQLWIFMGTKIRIGRIVYCAGKALAWSQSHDTPCLLLAAMVWMNKKALLWMLLLPPVALAPLLYQYVTKKLRAHRIRSLLQQPAILGFDLDHTICR
jgi:hypothetical protein